MPSNSGYQCANGCPRGIAAFITRRFVNDSHSSRWNPRPTATVSATVTYLSSQQPSLAYNSPVATVRDLVVKWLVTHRLEEGGNNSRSTRLRTECASATSEPHLSPSCTRRSGVVGRGRGWNGKRGAYSGSNGEASAVWGLRGESG